VDWQFLGGAHERALIVGMQVDKAGFVAAKQRSSPRELSVMETFSLAGGDGKVDYVARVKNPNSGWSAELDYAFLLGSAESKRETGYVLPGEETFLISYGAPDAGGSAPTFRAKEIRWMRVSPHKVGPYAPFAAARLRFDVGVPQQTFVDFGGKRITKTTFMVTNRSSYSYWHVPLIVSLSAGGAPLAIQTVALLELKAGESRPVEASWYADVPPGTIPTVTPHVNLFDAANYMAVTGTPGTDIREQKIVPISTQ
jgi:hypothetical protein